jgi:hypothetical protein
LALLSQRVCYVGLLERGSLLRQSEIEQLDTLFSDQDIRGLQITVSDALAMSGVQSVENLTRVCDSLVYS